MHIIAFVPAKYYQLLHTPLYGLQLHAFLVVLRDTMKIMIITVLWRYVILHNTPAIKQYILCVLSYSTIHLNFFYSSTSMYICSNATVLYLIHFTSSIQDLSSVISNLLNDSNRVSYNDFYYYDNSTGGHEVCM